MLPQPGIGSIPPSIMEGSAIMDSPLVLSHRNSLTEEPFQEDQNPPPTALRDDFLSYIQNDQQSQSSNAVELPTSFNDGTNDAKHNVLTISNTNSSNTNSSTTRSNSTRTNTVSQSTPFIPELEDSSEALPSFSLPTTTASATQLNSSPPLSSTQATQSTIPITTTTFSSDKDKPQLPLMSPKRKSYQVSIGDSLNAIKMSDFNSSPPLPTVGNTANVANNNIYHQQQQQQQQTSSKPAVDNNNNSSSNSAIRTHSKSPSETSNFSIGSLPREALMYNKLSQMERDNL